MWFSSKIIFCNEITFYIYAKLIQHLFKIALLAFTILSAIFYSRIALPPRMLRILSFFVHSIISNSGEALSISSFLSPVFMLIIFAENTSSSIARAVSILRRSASENSRVSVELGATIINLNNDCFIWMYK
jgi:hypothetical protein